MLTDTVEYWFVYIDSLYTEVFLLKNRSIEIGLFLNRHGRMEIWIEVIEEIYLFIFSNFEAKTLCQYFAIKIYGKKKKKKN